MRTLLPSKAGAKLHAVTCSPQVWWVAATDGHAEGEESGSAVIAIVVTDGLVEVWSQGPAQGWANPSLVRHDEITNIQYLR